MDIFGKIVENIIKAQEGLMGTEVAVGQAKKVQGLTIDWPNHKITVTGNKKEILGKLVEQYEHLFGPASIEVCKDAIRGIVSQVPSGQLPQSLI